MTGEPGTGGPVHRYPLATVRALRARVQELLDRLGRGDGDGSGGSGGSGYGDGSGGESGDER